MIIVKIVGISSYQINLYKPNNMFMNPLALNSVSIFVISNINQNKFLLLTLISALNPSLAQSNQQLLDQQPRVSANQQQVGNNLVS